MKYGCQSMVEQIRSVLVKHPFDAFIDRETLQAQWAGLNYSGCPDYKKALNEYDTFVGLLREHVPEIHFLPHDSRVSIDSIYAHDSAIITRLGAILCSMTREQRQPEPAAMSDALRKLRIPILGAITGEGRLESGDVLWIDERTLAVGRGARTNQEGIRQLQQFVSGLVDELIVVDLPSQAFHLMGMISLIDHNLALVNCELLPPTFREALLRRGMKLLEVPIVELKTLACNVLAVSPRNCMILANNPLTKKLLECEGVNVLEYPGEEISLKGCGGPTCLTRPILRMQRDSVASL